MVADLGWVDFDFCPARSAKLPLSLAESGRRCGKSRLKSTQPRSASTSVTVYESEPILGLRRLLDFIKCEGDFAYLVAASVSAQKWRTRIMVNNGHREISLVLAGRKFPQKD